jgi:RNA polymerase sigma factor (sigma-70 family)
MPLGAAERVEFASRIFAEYDLAIRAMIRQHVSGPEEQEDAYQNLYLSLVCCPPPSLLDNPIAYLGMIVKRDAINAGRRVRRGQESLRRYAMGRRQNGAENDPAEEAVRTETMQRVTHWIDSLLPTHEAKAVTGRYRNDCSISDIATEMGVRKRTVSRYLCMGLRRIRQAVLADCRGDYPTHVIGIGKLP